MPLFPAPSPTLHSRREDDLDLPLLVWTLPQPACVIASSVLGGGIGERSWIINAQVRSGYGRIDPAAHLAELATAVGLHDIDRGVGLLTAADVGAWPSAEDDGVRVDTTVGVRVPTWASAPVGTIDRDLTLRPTPGTINIVAFVPVPMTAGALVNLVATATEAKTQALFDAGVPGTGTATDAVVLVCPIGPPADQEPFGGPRSTYGSALARAVHATVLAGTADSLKRMATDPSKPTADTRPTTSTTSTTSTTTPTNPTNPTKNGGTS